LKNKESMKRKNAEEGFTITELLVVLVIIGILVLLALPRLLPIITKAKSTEAKLQLKQLHTLQKSYKFEYDIYGKSLEAIGFEQEKTVLEGGTARYIIKIEESNEMSFRASAKAVVDFDNDGTFNEWEVREDGVIAEIVPD